MKKILSINNLVWLVYLSLLAVLFPHTAWAFGQFEPVDGSPLVPWAAALAFEAAIAALTGKLSRHIEHTPKRISPMKKFSYRYLNAYSLGLVAALGLSSMANLAHAVEYGQPMVIFATWGIPMKLYAVAFGAVLPLISLTFARVLSNVVEDETEEDPALMKAKEDLKNTKHQLSVTQKALDEVNIELTASEQRFNALGDLVKRLFAEDKKERIIAVREQWPALPGASIAIIAGASQAYVSEVINSKQE